MIDKAKLINLSHMYNQIYDAMHLLLYSKSSHDQRTNL